VTGGGVPTRQSRLLALSLAGLALAEALAAVVLSVTVGWSFADAVDAFVVSNALIGVASAVSGSILATQRPRNPIGWLFLASGVAQALAAPLAPLGQLLVSSDAPEWLMRTAVTVFGWSWPWSIGLFLPLALLLFPDGRPPSRGWRVVVIAVVVTAPLFSAEMGASPEPLFPGLPPGYLTLPFYDSLKWLWTLTEIRGLLAIGLGIVALVVRYRRGSDSTRRQLLWLMLAAMVALGATFPWAFVAGTPVVVLFTIPLIPIAVTMAIVRHQLLDIRLVVSRALAWLLLSLAVLLAYVAVLALLDRFVSAQFGRSALVTVIMVLIAAPILPRLQRLVDRALYGDRDNPAVVVSRLGQQLATPNGDLRGILATVRTALRLPYAGLSQQGALLAGDGDPPDPSRQQIWPLEYDGRQVGELTVGLRAGERVLGPADQRVLGMLTAPIAVALHATAVSVQLQASQERIVAAQAEERDRIRRDLHDGLGPTLTGIAFTADAAANLLDSDRDQSAELLNALRRDARAALSDVRRIVEDLRPPVLDELGLEGALRQQVGRPVWRADGTPVQVQLELPERLPALPASVEVATYRIAIEALTNVLRHAQATRAVIELHCADRLEVMITDDGPADNSWTPGVGLQAMRERAAELGGRFEAGPTPDGWRVAASFPLEPVG
jgi:two-component system NarL family sensor kinase